MDKWLYTKNGYGPLEGMILPPGIMLSFICKYVAGKEKVTDESIDCGWFEPCLVKEMITTADIKKKVYDMLEFDGRQHFSTFENIDGKINFISDTLMA